MSMDVARYVKDRLQRKPCYQNFKTDLLVLQTAKKEETVKFVANSLVKKYFEEEPEFCEYFNKYWVERHQNWFAGYWWLCSFCFGEKQRHQRNKCVHKN